MSWDDTADDVELAVEDRLEDEDRERTGTARSRRDERQICPNCRILLSFREKLTGRCGNCHAQLEPVRN